MSHIEALITELQGKVGTEIGLSQWHTITQEQINQFADATGDHQWIHVDPARAAGELPGGRTIAHGLLVVGLIPRLQRDCYQIVNRGTGLNYGYDGMRFVSPVTVGSRVRLALTLKALERVAKGWRIETKQVMELEGSERPAIVTDHILLILDE